MNKVLFHTFLLAFYGAIILLCGTAARAQTVDQVMCGDGTFHGPDFDCRAYLCRTGWAQSHGAGDRCGSSSSRSADRSGAEGEAERARETERARVAAEQRWLADQQKVDEERREREHQLWLKGVADAAGSLKGVSSDDMQLKGVNDTAFFGLKGVSPDEAASNPNFGIKTGAFGGSPHSVIGAWKQLHCAAEFAGDAVADLKKIENGQADARELDEIKFVAGQASAVLHGGNVVVDTTECSASAPPMDVHLTSERLEQQAPVIDGLLRRTVHDAETYVAAQQRSDELRQRLNAAMAQQSEPDTKRVPREPLTSEQQPKSSAARSPVLDADQKHINEVYQQQKENERKKSDYLALLRETQRALNEVNSQKVASAADADKVEKETQAILAGQLPTVRTDPLSQSQNRLRNDQ